METPQYRQQLEQLYPRSVIDNMLTRFRLSFADFDADERFYFLLKSKCAQDTYISELRAAIAKLADMAGTPEAVRVARLAIKNPKQPAYPSGKRNIRDGNPKPSPRD